MKPAAKFICGDALEEIRKLEAHSVDCVVTSPPYWGLRDYGVPGQLGMEKHPDLFVESLVETLSECARAMRSDATMWVNIADSYIGGGRAGKNKEYMKRHTMFGRTVDESQLGRYGVPMGIPKGLKKKDMALVPQRFALAMQAAGFYVRSHVVGHKPNPMPSNCTDRPTVATESIFMFSVRPKYYYNAAAVKEIGKGGKPRNLRNVWECTVNAKGGHHTAAYPERLIEPCILAGSRPMGTVLDPFGGSGTTAACALRNCRNAISIDLNPEYTDMAERRCAFIPTRNGVL